MKKMGIVTAVLAAVLISAPAWAQHIQGSLHDLSTRLGTGEICISCHVPHGAMNPAAGPLWNHALTNGTGTGFTRIKSGVSSPKILYGNSLLCMGCHDGVTAVGNFNIAHPTAHGTEVNGTLTMGALISGFPVTASGSNPGSNPSNVTGMDFTNMHPVGSTYPAIGAPSSDMNAALPTPNSYPAGGYSMGGLGIVNLDQGKTPGTYDTIACSTCHNPHDDTYQPFLVMSNAGSGLCLQCHIK
jgi:predicted CXXCH cytochrome family protein